MRTLPVHGLAGKHAVCGVSGGVAAYKAATLVSMLTQSGCHVHVVMTRAATEFVSPLTFRSLTGNPVHVEMFEEPKVWKVEHIGLAEQADLAVVAPATANVLAKMAVGLADDFLSTVLLALTCPVFVAPAMNQAMWNHAATRHNLEVLRGRGVHIIGPATGMQACGAAGVGRMSEPEDIVAVLKGFLVRCGRWQGRRVVVTAGGTREPLDPVRYIGNASSGRMGHALAEAFQESGAEVILVTAAEREAPAGVRCVRVITAAQMRTAVLEEFANTDVVVKAAAVADYRPARVAGRKIKKTDLTDTTGPAADLTDKTGPAADLTDTTGPADADEASDAAGSVIRREDGGLSIELVPNPDILAELGRMKEKQFLVGFAAETHEVLANAGEKLRRKNADMFVVNDVTREGAGFGVDTNIVSVLFGDGTREDWPLLSKKELARRLVDVIGDRVLSEGP